MSFLFKIILRYRRWTYSNNGKKIKLRFEPMYPQLRHAIDLTWLLVLNFENLLAHCLFSAILSLDVKDSILKLFCQSFGSNAFLRILELVHLAFV